MLGGALAIHGNQVQEKGLQFWEDFVAKGGGDAIEIVAIHYNQGKSGGSTIEQFIGMIDTYRSIFGDKPIWVTEFGVLIADATQDGDTAGKFNRMTEEEGASWLIRFYTAGLNAGVSKFFSGYIGFVSKDVVQLTFYTNLLIQSKLMGFTESEKLTDGQYRFVVNGKSVYVLWGNSPTHESITGTISVTDIYGNVSQAERLRFNWTMSQFSPSRSSPRQSSAWNGKKGLSR